MQVEALSFEEDLQDRWATEALRWALHCSSRHLTERSHQVPCQWHITCMCHQLKPCSTPVCLLAQTHGARISHHRNIWEPIRFFIAYLAVSTRW